MALLRECPSCGYRNSSRARVCKRCGVSVQGKGIVWWVDVWLNDKRIRERIGPSKSMAEARELALKQKKAEIKVHPEKALEVLTLEEFWKRRYFVWVKVYNRSWSGKKYRWEKYIRPAFGKKRLDEIDRRDVDAYRVKRLSDGVRPATVNREVALLRHMLTVARKFDYIKENPLLGIGDLPENNDDRWRPLAKEEFLTLLKHINPHYRDVVEFAVASGMRIGNILGLTERDVDFDLGVIRIPGRKYKSGKPKIFPLSSWTEEILKRRLDRMKDGRFFPHSYAELRRAFKKALKEAELDESIRIHDLRHTFASWLAEEGESLKTIQELLGHAQIATTLRYAHLQLEVLRRAAEKITPVSREARKAGKAKKDHQNKE